MTMAMHSTWRSQCGRYTIGLHQDCFDDMARLARRHLPNEVGTSLAGSYSDDGFRAEIRRVAPVTEDSRGGSMTFVRGVRGLADFFRSLFAASKGRVHYIGEWHSHPRGAPTPSTTDDENALSIALDPKALCPECVLLILAVQDGTVELGVFVYSRVHGRVDLAQWIGDVDHQ